MNTDKARRSLEHYHVQKLLLSQGSLKKENRDALQRHLQEPAGFIDTCNS